MCNVDKREPLGELNDAEGVKVKERGRDVPPTVLSEHDRLQSHREAALLLAHLGRYYTNPC